MKKLDFTGNTVLLFVTELFIFGYHRIRGFILNIVPFQPQRSFPYSVISLELCHTTPKSVWKWKGISACDVQHCTKTQSRSLCLGFLGPPAETSVQTMHESLVSDVKTILCCHQLLQCLSHTHTVSFISLGVYSFFISAIFICAEHGTPELSGPFF